MPHPTQSDIAKKLNVTRITVSKALRGHPDISTGMKKRVIETASELGYIPNLIAQNLTTQRTYTLGVVIPDLENSFFAYATDSIIDAAAERNYNVFVTVSRERQQSEILNIQKLIGMRVDGLLVCVSQQTNDPSIFHQIKHLNIPLVFFDRKCEGVDFPTITFDDRNGAAIALDKIIKEGYTKIAHFAGYSTVSVGKERCLGYKHALKKNGIETNPEWIIEGGFEIADGYSAFMKLYNTIELPEIIFTVNDRVALGVYKAMGEVGLRIPDDIGVLGFGFSDTAQTFSPSLSIISQNPRRVGGAAAKLLIELITNPDAVKSRDVIIEETLLWNESILKKHKRE
jgi:LacI family transcriptional regulator